MANAAHRYMQRSPRYVLRPLDHSLMRFKGASGSIQTAEVIDLSETGLSFLTPSHSTPDELPRENEFIKLEFTIPGHKQIACFATVIRSENLISWSPEFGDSRGVKIAIRFHSLPKAYHRALQLSLKKHLPPNPEQCQESEFAASGSMPRTPDIRLLLHFIFASLALILVLGLKAMSLAWLNFPLP